MELLDGPSDLDAISGARADLTRRAVLFLQSTASFSWIASLVGSPSEVRPCEPPERSGGMFRSGRRGRAQLCLTPA